jgi:glycosyltransferase involved in cell wall biosynthesis
MQVWDMIHGFRDMPSGFLCTRCEEAAVLGSNDAESGETDVVVALLPPSGLNRFPAWVDSCVAELEAGGFKVAPLDLDRACRASASAIEEALWTEPLTDEHPPEEAFRQLLNRRGGREIVKRCVEDLLEVPNRAVAFVVDDTNMRFTREVVERYQKHRPTAKLVVLDARNEPPGGDGWRSTVDGWWQQNDDLVPRLSEVVARQRLKILMVHPDGIEDMARPWTIRSVKTAVELAAMGHTVRFCHHSKLRSPEFADASPEGLESIPLGRGRFPWSLASRFHRLVRLARQSDVVHVLRCGVVDSLPAILAALVSRKPLHYDWFDHREAMRNGSKGAWLSALWHQSFRRAVARFVPRIAVPSSVASPGLRPAERGTWIPAGRILSQSVGVDTTQFHPETDGSAVRGRYGLFGDLVVAVIAADDCGSADLLSDAARRVRLQRPDVAFVVLERHGRVSHRSGLSGMGDEGTETVFAGTVPHAEMPDHLGAADVVVVPFVASPGTRCESPLVIAESFACGTPVVAGNVGDVAAIVGDAGIFVEPGSSQALAYGILQLLADEHMRQRMAKRARTRAEEKYSWKNLAAAVAAAYESSISPVDSRPRA